MKKTVLVLLCLFAALLCGCDKKEQNIMETKSGKTVSFINNACGADVWILPETEENLKTTVWGTATVSKTETGESYEAQLAAADGSYIFRMIDTEEFFYSANGIELENGWTLQIKSENSDSVILEVSDGNGALKKTYEVFKARL
ncbi:MAG: hypothetical protein J5590_05895 [Clostridia bacterium]|nr:hypothetical protein [Clostridia bacterium]